MYNWSVDEKVFKKADPKGYKIWRIIQLINYGLDDEERLEAKELKKLWPKIKDQLDPDRAKTMEFFLWGKKWRKEKGLRVDRKNFWQWYFKRQLSLKSST